MWPSLTNCLHYLIEQKKKKKTPEISQCSNRKTFGQNVPVVFFFFFLIKDIVVYLREH